jgi:hypothetical protein
LLQGVDSEDEEELEGPETFRASAARIERPQKDDKWKNPTKILKRPEPSKEKKLVWRDKMYVPSQCTIVRTVG